MPDRLPRRLARLKADAREREYERRIEATVETMLDALEGELDAPTVPTRPRYPLPAGSRRGSWRIDNRS